jgi:hypothetical protein
MAFACARSYGDVQEDRVMASKIRIWVNVGERRSGYAMASGKLTACAEQALTFATLSAANNWITTSGWNNAAGVEPGKINAYACTPYVRADEVPHA